MCPQKVCPSCHTWIPARAMVCTTNGCRHIFDESQPSVIRRTYPVGQVDLMDDPYLRERFMN